MAWQARQPLYKTSVARWANNRAHIDPMIEVLGMDDAALEFASLSTVEQQKKSLELANTPKKSKS